MNSQLGKKVRPSHVRLSFYWLLFVLTLYISSCVGEQSIIGKWHKTSGGICAAIYPATVEFFDDGEYVGGLLNWSGGRYRLVGAKRLRLDTSTGPGVYDLSVSHNTLTFRNDQGCEFKYQRGR
jgi:hypothetical protein